MGTATLLLLILAVLIALFIAIFQYIFKNKEKSQLNYWLSFLRFLSLFTIFVLIINPTIQKSSVTIKKPNLLVAIDNSTSIKYNKQVKTVTSIVNQLKSNKPLNTKFNINYFSFGQNVSSLDSLNFNQNYTNLSAPIKEFSNLYKSGINPVILISDGNHTIGNNVQFETYKGPVYPFIVGDTTVFEDIYINQLNTNKYVYINNKLPVELFVNYTGTKPTTKNLQIFHNSKIVYSKSIGFSKTKNVQNVSFYLPANEKGIQYYTAKIGALENEQNLHNNTQTFGVTVIEEKSKILVVTDIIHPDLGMLKKSIESNQQSEVVIKFSKNKIGNITDYQLIVLYQPNNSFKYIFTEINSNKLNYFVVSGLQTDWNFLNTIQPIFKKNVIANHENYFPVLNPNYEKFINSDINFTNFSPLNSQFGDVSFSTPYNSLLFQKTGTITTEKPLLATFENESQIGGILFGENSWRWRMNSFVLNQTFEHFDGFMANLIQYLTSNAHRNKLNTTLKPLYYANETIHVSASFLDENLNFDNRAKLWLTVTNKKTNFYKKVRFSVFNNQYKTELSNIPPAEYLYTVSVENQTDKVLGTFKIVPFEIEKQHKNSTDFQLKQLAKKTNGELFYSGQEQNMLNDLLLDERYKSTLHSEVLKTPLIEWKWLLGFILFILSIEWFVRKYFGKI